jgi:hypothetical protein
MSDQSIAKFSRFKIERLEDRIAPSACCFVGCCDSHRGGSNTCGSHSGGSNKCGKGNNGYGNGGRDGSPNGKQDCTR